MPNHDVLVLVPGSRIRIFQCGREVGDAVVSYVDEFKQEVGVKKLQLCEMASPPEKATIRIVRKNDGWRELIEKDEKTRPAMNVSPIEFEIF